MSETVPLSARLSFAASGTATGLVSNGVAFFLLIYYSQVLGLDPALAGLALMISLVCDAVSDPLVGRWSDRLRHRWGRRHPFLYASVVPIAVCYYLIWDPPELSQWGLFAYLLGLAVTLRLAVTLHAVPFNALAPEVAPAYDGRTQLMNYSYSGAWFFGTLMAVLMYAYWLADAPGAPYGSGVLRAGGYVEAGAVAAVAISLCLLAAAAGTHRHIPRLAPPPKRAGSVAGLWRESTTTLRDRDMFALLVSGLATSAASGTSMALWAYMQPYFWGFDSEQTSVILAAQLASAVIAFLCLPLMTRGRDKRPVLIWLSALSIAVHSGPVLLALTGLFPLRGTATLFITMTCMGVVQVALIVMTSVVTASMIADVVESRAAATGRREEGLVFAVLSFIGKVATGIGVWMGGLTLALINFPADTYAQAVAPETIERLGWVYGPLIAAFYLVSIAALRFFGLDRATHEANLRRLATTAKEH